jgi:hypothetical protein
MTIELRDMPGWPAALSLEEAVAYSGLSTSAIRRAVREGELVFKPLGFNGKKIVPRQQIDRYLQVLFAQARWPGEPLEYPDFSKPYDVSEDLDFGDRPPIEKPRRRGKR